MNKGPHFVRKAHFMTPELAFGIGAIFLLVALLMFGTMSGFISRIFRAGKPAPVFVGSALLLLAGYRFWPDVYAGWRSIASAAPALPTSRHPPIATPPAPASHPAMSTAPRTRVTKEPTP